jgi:hypothetical protein
MAARDSNVRSKPNLKLRPPPNRDPLSCRRALKPVCTHTLRGFISLEEQGE